MSRKLAKPKKASMKLATFYKTNEIKIKGCPPNAIDDEHQRLTNTVIITQQRFQKF